tara:strand:+ start:806 stop:1027 length:222 start_codon:yes stop_codon:yes gene_type:complete
MPQVQFTFYAEKDIKGYVSKTIFLDVVMNVMKNSLFRCVCIVLIQAITGCIYLSLQWSWIIMVALGYFVKSQF